MDQIACNLKALLNGIMSTGVTTDPSLNRFILLNISGDNSKKSGSVVEWVDIDLLLRDNGFSGKYLELQVPMKRQYVGGEPENFATALLNP